MIEQPKLDWTLETRESRLVIQYRLTNQAAQSILVFDRLWDSARQELDRQWAYVAIADGIARIRRGLASLPRGLRFDEPPVPYAREVAPRALAEGLIELAIPLAENDPYLHITRTGEPARTPVRTVVLAIAWCPVPAPGQLPPGVAPVPVEGENLLLLPYGTVNALQKEAAGVPRTTALEGLVRAHR